MFPTLSPDNIVGVSNRYAIAFANVPQNQAAGTDCHNVRVGEFRLPVARSLWAAAVSRFIRFIFFMRGPAKISGPVVVDVAVPVGNLMNRRRLFAVERPANDNTNSAAFGGAEIENMVSSTLRHGFDYGSLVGIPPSQTGDDDTIDRPYAPETRSFIARMLGDWTPFFGFSRNAFRRIVHVVGSRHVLPYKVVSNGRNGTARDAEAFCYSRYVTSIRFLRAQSSDFSNVGFGEFGPVRPLTAKPRAMPDLVKSVGGYRGPSQVIGSVIAAVSVIMGNFVSGRRSRSVERCANQSMNELTEKRRAFVNLNRQDDEGKCGVTPRRRLECLNLLLGNADRQIWSASIHSKNGAPVSDEPALLRKNKTVQRSDPSKARCLVTKVSWHWTPFLDFGYGLFSHFALLQREVRGWRRGERLSSVPHSIYLAFSPQGITILAART